MNDRERFQAWMHYRDADRAPFYEWLGYWSETINRWRAEGLPIGVSVNDYFNFDKKEAIPIDLGPIPRFIRRTLEENERYEIFIDWSGITMKRLKTSTSMPLFIDFPVKNKKDWEVIKERFNPDDVRRLPLTWSRELFEYYSTTDRVVYLSLTGFFGYARNLMGLNRLLVAFYREPDLVADIMDFWAEFLLKILEKVLNNIKPDYVTIWEDMCYRSGPLISPKLFEEFMLPNYKKVTSFIRSKGVDIIMVDTDGNHIPITDLFIEGGVNCLYPLEVAAGVNAVKLREEYGRKLLLIGNVDKRALILGNKAVDREIERIKPLLEEKGYIVSVDHCVPADVSFQNYMYYIKRVKKMIQEV